MSVLAVIPARYGSVRFPGKPLAPIAGKPMVQHVYEQVGRARRVHEIVVATDDARVRDAVQAFGGTAVMTSPKCASGTERAAEVARLQRDAQVILNVQGDEPLVRPEMVDQLAGFLQAHGAVPMATLRTRWPGGMDLSARHMVKVVVDADGFALYFSRAPIPGERADGLIAGLARPAYKHLGLYGYQRHFLLQFSSLEPTPLELCEGLEQLRALEHGHRIKVLETAHDTIGVDTPDDLRRVEELIGRTVSRLGLER
jgi:3-deoxy-manno-octulosonate cytidylyltransferase (CMP-KDO synthetase)